MRYSRLLALCISVCITFGALSGLSAAPAIGLGNLTTSGEGSFAQIVNTFYRAVVFQTHSDTTTITDFKMRYFTVDLSPNINITVNIYLSDASGTRGALVGTLGTNTYTSFIFPAETTIFTPATTITLTPNTFYFLEIQSDSTNAFAWATRNPRIAPSGLFTFVQIMSSVNSGATWTVDSVLPSAFELAVEVVTPVAPVVLSPDTTALGCDVTANVGITADNTYCRVLMKNGAVVNYAGAVPQNLINLGVILAVDVYRLQGGQSITDFGGYSRICLAGQGRLFYLDARNAPRTYFEMPTQREGGLTCGWIPAAGTLVLTNE